MNGSTWPIRLAEVVGAPPGRVMAWWFHPDRKDEVQGRVTGGEAIDFVLGESATDGVRVRTISFRDRRGWDHHHRVERHLTPDGKATRSGDRFIVPIRDVSEMRSPRGQRITLECEGRMEFIPRPDGATEVYVEHSHTLVGGNWATRRAIRRSDPGKEDQMFEDMIAECKVALGTE
jgi:hypothetical protein